MGPNDRLIHVYHFTKETAQNQVVLYILRILVYINRYAFISINLLSFLAQQQVQNFGEPFFLVIHEGETLAEVKARIQKKLQVPDEEFSKVLPFTMKLVFSLYQNLWPKLCDQVFVSNC